MGGGVYRRQNAPSGDSSRYQDFNDVLAGREPVWALGSGDEKSHERAEERTTENQKIRELDHTRITNQRSTWSEDSEEMLTKCSELPWPTLL
jgi:hypothetical protein